MLCAYDSMPFGDRVPKIFWPKGMYSVHYAVTKYLTNHPMFCSDSINCADLLDLGVLSHAIIPVGLSPSYVSSRVRLFCSSLIIN